MKIALMYQFDNDALQKTLAFIGADAEQQAKAAFKEYTGISFDEYKNRRENGPDDDMTILGETNAGSTVEVIEAKGELNEVDIRFLYGMGWRDFIIGKLSESIREAVTKIENTVAADKLAFQEIADRTNDPTIKEMALRAVTRLNTDYLL